MTSHLEQSLCEGHKPTFPTKLSSVLPSRHSDCPWTAIQRSQKGASHSTTCNHLPCFMSAGGPRGDGPLTRNLLIYSLQPHKGLSSRDDRLIGTLHQLLTEFTGSRHTGAFDWCASLMTNCSTQNQELSHISLTGWLEKRQVDGAEHPNPNHHLVSCLENIKEIHSVGFGAGFYGRVWNSHWLLAWWL